MGQEYLVTPKEAPALNIPSSFSQVQVSIIDTTSYISLGIDAFLEPTYPGKTQLTGPAYSFLIKHAASKQTLLFDLGIRKDVSNLPPVIVSAIKSKNWTVKADKNVAEILTSHNIDVAAGDINAVIWSHHHWDHVGDLHGTFPSSTTLIVGPGFRAAHLPGYPTNPESPLHEHDFADREVRELDIASLGNGLKIGRFNALDFFGDGSFYLLDTPGHSVGHICGLARTSTSTSTSSPSAAAAAAATFVFMGGDASHHGGEFRPSEYLPLPTSITPSPLKKFQPSCPGHLLQEAHREKSAAEPFYLVKESFAQDLTKCNWTIEGMQEFDADENVLVVVAHDESLLDVLEFFPKGLNDWRSEGLGEKGRWAFLGDFEEAVADK